MEESKKEIPNAEVVYKDANSNEINDIGALIQGVVTPFSQAQETSQKESTKRAEILAGVANKAIYALFGIAALILTLAGYAVSQGNDALAEKLVIALLAFLGGLGAGKAVNK